MVSAEDYIATLIRSIRAVTDCSVLQFETVIIALFARFPKSSKIYTPLDV